MRLNLHYISTQIVLIFVGSVASVRHMKRHRVILNGDKKNNYRGFLDNKIFDSNKSFSKSCDKRIAQVIGASSDGEFVLQPTNDIQKTLTAIYKFSRPYTFIGIVSIIRHYWTLRKKFKIDSINFLIPAKQITAISSVSLLPLTSLGDLSPAVFVGFLKVEYCSFVLSRG